MAGIQDSLRRLQDSIKGLSDASALVGASSTASNASENSARSSSTSRQQQQLDHHHHGQTRHIFQNDLVVEQQDLETSDHADYYGPHDRRRRLADRDKDTRRQQLPAAGAADRSYARSPRSSTAGSNNNNDSGNGNGSEDARGDNSSRRLRRGSLFREREQVGLSGVGLGGAPGAFLSASDGVIMAESAEVGVGVGVGVMLLHTVGLGLWYDSSIDRVQYCTVLYGTVCTVLFRTLQFRTYTV